MSRHFCIFLYHFHSILLLRILKFFHMSMDNQWHIIRLFYALFDIIFWHIDLLLSLTSLRYEDGKWKTSLRIKLKINIIKISLSEKLTTIYSKSKVRIIGCIYLDRNKREQVKNKGKSAGVEQIQPKYMSSWVDEGPSWVESIWAQVESSRSRPKSSRIGSGQNRVESTQVKVQLSGHEPKSSQHWAHVEPSRSGMISGQYWAESA